ncbi:MAG: FdhF/YdeP family oxidoreductase [Nitrospinaceae bacterium]|nr:FdhF/YdeP family oxidoreductase [Nitrospinaceae bacterium]MBT3433620.1 FdhF/YdeP family oxidoreductase [Nitrospinaceae bacterium]MBT3821221.1 FdhF/YdeP family oxidoreductase [Nitrospinaceae bacterium]MBT4094166.1 FdhF/YdeP family oxidoreductase [Nitrospinaceae bacterium]MBT4430022.1 FdhF/YdeP family oxidoreductase [Nitrospinaceae bacterium]
MKISWNPALWVGLVPNGFGKVKPNHYRDMLKVVWQNRDELPFAWRILRDGVCDGCALGTTGLHDFTMDGIHLCMSRLNLLRLNTMRGMDVSVLEDIEGLKKMTGAELRELGRLPFPMIRRRGEPGFRRIDWDEAYGVMAERIRATNPSRIAFYLTSRGITNEVYYVAQKAARFLGTNNIDYSARICHSPSTVALKQSLGVAASTCSYKDWLDADLLIFAGSNTPNSQPVTTKYIYLAKQRGAKVAVINPHREPGLQRYWIPSVLESAMFGTKLADEFFSIHTGGDVAFLNGVLKYLIEQNLVDKKFIQDKTEAFDGLRAILNEQSWELLESHSGASRSEIQKFGDMYASSRKAVFVWSMGLTQHVFGVENVQAIINLALARGMVGREGCGVMPIRGHSGVQGGAEVGCVPTNFPGGDAINTESAKALGEIWKFEPPSQVGLSAVEMVESSHAGEMDVLYFAGGNFIETLPEPDYVREALGRIPLRVHQDIVLSTPMLEEPGDTVLLLPAQTRYEQAGGGCETTTERRIIFSPEISGRRVGESRSEWQILMELAEHVYPERRDEIHFDDAASIRTEISKTVPLYGGIENLENKGDALQWGGRRLCEGGNFGTPDGKAHFKALNPPALEIPDGWFFLSTRRGKQFNSMVLERKDSLTGAGRDDVLISKKDADDMGLRDGSLVVLKSEAGEFRGHIKVMPIKPRNVQVHWPEGNVLIKRGHRDPRSGVPDYNAMVQLIPEDGAL